jgi:hypothetical protein
MNFKKKINEIKTYYEAERKKTETDWAQEKGELENEIQKLNQSLNKEKLDLKNTKDELSHIKLDNKNIINKLSNNF